MPLTWPLPSGHYTQYQQQQERLFSVWGVDPKGFWCWLCHSIAHLPLQSQEKHVITKVKIHVFHKDKARAVCWQLPGAGTLQSSESCQRNGCDCGAVVQWHDWEGKKTPAKMTMVLAFSLLAAITNQCQFLRLLRLIIKASKLLTAAHYRRLKYSQTWHWMVPYKRQHTHFQCFLIAIIAKLDSVTEKAKTIDTTVTRTLCDMIYIQQETVLPSTENTRPTKHITPNSNCWVGKFTSDNLY